MKRIILALVFLVSGITTFGAYSQSTIGSWNNPISYPTVYPPNGFHQQQHTYWCAFACIEMKYGVPQCASANQAVIYNYHNPFYDDCCNPSTSSAIQLCYDTPLAYGDDIPRLACALANEHLTEYNLDCIFPPNAYHPNPQFPYIIVMPVAGSVITHAVMLCGLAISEGQYSLTISDPAGSILVIINCYNPNSVRVFAKENVYWY
jgi:hypothetical protein